MLEFLNPLREITENNGVWIALFRLSVAAFCGGCIGLERGKKRRPAGFRTYMLVCMSATLTMLISQYLTMMVGTYWTDVTLVGVLAADLSLSVNDYRAGERTFSC